MRKSVLTLTVSGLLLTSPVWAGPEGGEVVSGSATIVNSAGGTTIQQATDRAILNWNRFNINPGEFVRFLQPSTSSAVLNRVTGINPSYLMGELSATGRVFLVNPSGIVFGPNSQVNVGSLFATTMQISDQDFMSGNYQFVPAGSPSFVLNQGTIHAADGGYVVLMAPLVENQGTIVARLGTVTLASVPQTTVNFDGQGLVHYVLPEAPSPDVMMQSDLVSDVVGGLVPTSTTDAAGVELADGQVRLVGGAGLALNSGSVQADQVNLTGPRVGLTGSLEGSQVQVLGDQYAYTATGSLIRADNALIKAGDSLLLNGQTEISPGGYLDTSAPGLQINQPPTLGEGGTWLIDPNNLTITTLYSGPGTTPASPFTTLGDDAWIDPMIIETALATNATVIVRTGTAGANSEPGDIRVWDPIDPLTANPNGTPTLILQAHHDIIVQNDIGGTNPLNLDLQANYLNTTTDGSVRLQVGFIDTQGGSFNASGVDYVQGVQGLVRTQGGDAHINVTGDIDVSGQLDLGATGDADLLAGGDISVLGSDFPAVVGDRLLVRTPTGDVDLLVAINSLQVDAPGAVSVENDLDLQLISVGSLIAPTKFTAFTDGTLTGQGNGSPDLTAAAADLTALSGIQLNTQVNTLDLLSFFDVTILQATGNLALLQADAENLLVLVPGGNLGVGAVFSGGQTSLGAGGNIMPLAISAINSNGGAVLSAGNRIGSPATPMSVTVSGTLQVQAGGQQNGVSVDINGSVDPSNTVAVADPKPPGQVIFNGQVVYQPPPAPPAPPPPPVVPPVTPVDPTPPPPDPVPPAPPPPSTPDQSMDTTPPPPPPPPATDPNLPAMVDEAVGGGQQQLNNLTPPPPPPPPPGNTNAPDLVNNPGAGNTAQNSLGFNSSMSNLEPPQRGDADRFVLAALLQASVNAPTSYLAQIENTSGTMSQSDYASYLSSIMGQSVDLSGPSPVSLEEVLTALFSLYHIEAGPGGVVAKATELGLLPEGVGSGELTRGEVYEILDAAFFNLKMPNGRTLYQASFDSTPPTVSIGTFPAVVEGTTLTLQGTVSPGTTLLQVGYNDSDVVTVGEDGTWTTSVPLEPGMNTITVQAHDAAGNITTRTIQVLCTAGGA